MQSFCATEERTFIYNAWEHTYLLLLHLILGPISVLRSFCLLWWFHFAPYSCLLQIVRNLSPNIDLKKSLYFTVFCIIKSKGIWVGFSLWDQVCICKWPNNIQSIWTWKLSLQFGSTFMSLLMQRKKIPTTRKKTNTQTKPQHLPQPPKPPTKPNNHQGSLLVRTTRAGCCPCSPIRLRWQNIR